eukprot:COSAG04_NODE_9141_length_894_cov_1.329560_1_plen_41_part_10
MFLGEGSFVFAGRVIPHVGRSACRADSEVSHVMTLETREDS